MKAVDLMNRFFTNDVWDLLVTVTETNRYAALNISTASRPRPWKPVMKEEMKAFIGILMAMGIFRLPRLECYWKHNCRQTQTPGISEIMSKT